MNSWILEGADFIREINELTLPEEYVCLWPIGQVGYFMKNREKVVLIDPVMTPICDDKGESCLHFEAPFSPEADFIIDAVFCTHNHMDHLNPDTVRTIAKSHPKVQFYIPKGVMEETKQIFEGFKERVHGIRQQECIKLREGCQVTAVAAPHDHYAADEEGNEKALGYVFDFGEKKIFHAGDTVATDRLVSEVLACGNMDLALLPINGRDWVREGNNIIGNMTPQEAALFAECIGCKKVIPTHYDLWKGNEESPMVFAHYMYLKYPHRPFHFLKPGEKFIL